jgi:hypothetical protein
VTSKRSISSGSFRSRVVPNPGKGVQIHRVDRARGRR